MQNTCLTYKSNPINLNHHLDNQYRLKVDIEQRFACQIASSLAKVLYAQHPYCLVNRVISHTHKPANTGASHSKRVDNSQNSPISKVVEYQVRAPGQLPATTSTLLYMQVYPILPSGTNQMSRETNDNQAEKKKKKEIKTGPMLSNSLCMSVSCLSICRNHQRRRLGSCH